MKKFLSLVLALVMTMSLVTISASAKDFTDDDKITYEEAVAVVSEIGVVDGYADGKFNPTNTLTRQAAAKIICNLILGPTTAAELHADTAPYKDVPATSQFAGYIAYCAKEGIISGYADGTFKPGNSLTGYAFMKMLLGALGYDQEIEGYVGGNWSINVAKQAIAIGLNDSLVDEFNGIKAVTREEACLYAFNTLKADLVEYDTTITSTVNGQTVTIGNSKAQAKKWGTSATRINNIKKDEYIQFGEQYFNKLYLDETADSFGRPARAWEFKGKDIGTFVNYDLLVEEYTAKVTGKDLYDLLGKTIIEDYDTVVYIDGVDDVKVNSNIFNATAMNKNNKAGVGGTGDGVLTQVFVDSDSKDITIAIINTYLARATADYSEKKDSVTFEVYKVDDSKGELVKTKGQTEKLTVSGEDFDIADVAEKDAYLVNVAEGEIKVLTKAEVVEDTEISSFKIGDNVTAGGTKYGFANTAMYDAEVLDYYTGINNTVNLKDTTYNIYLDQYGYLIGIEEVEAVKNYVFITGVDTGLSNLANKTADANAIFLDGTSEVIKVDMTKSTGVPADPRANSWFSYTVNKDGVYTLKIVASEIDKANGVKTAQYHDATGDVEIDKKHVSLAGGNQIGSAYAKVYGNDDSIYLTAELKAITDKNSASTTIISGVDNVTTGVKNANLKTWSEATVNAKKSTQYGPSGVYTLYKDNGYVIAAVVVGEDDAASKNLVYTHKSSVELESYDKAADEWTWTRKVISNGEEIVLTEVSDSLSYLNNMAQYTWYQVKYNAAGEVIGVTDADAVGAGADAKTDIYAQWDLKANEYVTDINKVETAINAEDTVLYTQAFSNDVPSLKGSTLFVSTKSTQGFFVAEDAKVVLIQTNDLKQTTTYEVGVDALEDMIDDLNAVKDSNPAVYNYTVSAILEDGAATSVIIYDRVDATGNPGTSTPVAEADYDATVTPSINASGKIVVDLECDAIASWKLGNAVAEYSVIMNGKEYTSTQNLGTVDFSALNLVVPGLTVKNGTEVEVNVVVTFNGTTEGVDTAKTYTVGGTGYIL